ncbi:MAG: hypothetical protein ACQEUB_13195 [Thermodesulfobacteriota bacterium]
MAWLVCVIGILPVSQVLAWTPESLDWSAWDSKHSVARKETWMVIREPGRDGCYLKQSYAGERMMDLTVDESDTPCLWGPFSPEPVDVQVNYRIDDFQEGQITAKEVTNGIRLPQELVKTMRRGFLMQVEVQSLDSEVDLGTRKEQEFSLLGFIAATEVLNSDACRE